MLQTTDGEKEILLGNKQLFGIFFVVAVLLGAAFAGGYEIGRGAAGKNTTVAAAAGETTPAQANNASATGGQTLSVPPASGSQAAGAQPEDGKPVDGNPDTSAAQNAAIQERVAQPEGTPLGSARNRRAEEVKKETPSATAATPSDSRFIPQGGQTFLQVAAVGRDEAEAVADVLHKKGFRAHAVPKPGTKLYRVLIGPVRDVGDLSSTKEALRRTGFREVIVQRY